MEVIASEDSAKCSPASRSLSSASTAVPESKMSEARVVPLMRERRRVGELVVRWRIEELDSAHQVLRRSTQHSLDDITTALTKILSGPWGKTLMMDSLPSEVCRTNQQATSQARHAIGGLFCDLFNDEVSCTIAVCGNSTETLARSFQVCLCACVCVRVFVCGVFILSFFACVCICTATRWPS